MPLYERYMQGVRSDGRGNYRYRALTTEQVVSHLTENGWSLDTNGSLRRDPEPQFTSILTASRAIIEEQRPFAPAITREAMEHEVMRGLEVGVEYRTGMASYVAGRITAPGGYRVLVRRLPNPGSARLVPEDTAEVSESTAASWTQLGDPELERLLFEEEQIETAVREQRDRMEQAAQRQRDAHAQVFAYTVAAPVVEPAVACEPRPGRAVLQDVGEAIAATVPAPSAWPGYDGRLP